MSVVFSTNIFSCIAPSSGATLSSRALLSEQEQPKGSQLTALCFAQTSWGGRDSQTALRALQPGPWVLSSLVQIPLPPLGTQGGLRRDAFAAMVGGPVPCVPGGSEHRGAALTQREVIHDFHIVRFLPPQLENAVIFWLCFRTVTRNFSPS